MGSFQKFSRYPIEPSATRSVSHLGNVRAFFEIRRLVSGNMYTIYNYYLFFFILNVQTCAGTATAHPLRSLAPEA